MPPWIASAYERAGGGTVDWVGASRGTAGGGALGQLGLPEVGLEGGGGTEEEGGDEVQGVPHDVTGQKRSYEGPGSLGR